VRPVTEYHVPSSNCQRLLENFPSVLSWNRTHWAAALCNQLCSPTLAGCVVAALGLVTKEVVVGVGVGGAVVVGGVVVGVDIPARGSVPRLAVDWKVIVNRG
jgi:hypothetical protein